MANTQMITPAICPTPSLSSKPAHNKPMMVRGSNEKSDSKYTQTVLNEVPDVGPDIEVDRGPMTKEYK